jgi:hypothetical protein
MKKPTALTEEEKRVIKALLIDGMRNQDIHMLVNYERKATINFGRIAGVKKDANISPASPEEVAFFKRKKRSFDPITGLNLYGDERLIRAREAMKSRTRKFEQDAKWSFCLTAGTISPRIRREHEQTTAPEPHPGLQGEGGACRRQRRPNDSSAGRAL